MSKNVGIAMNKPFISKLNDGKTYSVIVADSNENSVTMIVSKVFDGETWTRKQFISFADLQNDFENGKYAYL
jgi:hypothetical protein